MDRSEYWLQWIVSDFTPFVFGDRSYFLSTPSREMRFQAECIFHEVYKDTLTSGLVDEIGLSKLLLKYNLWDEDKENKLKDVLHSMEDIKVNIFESYLNTSRKKFLKQSLRDSNTYIENALSEKHSMDGFAAKSVAAFAKQHFLLGSSIFIAKGKPLFRSSKWWATRDDEIVNSLYRVVSSYIINESEYREIVKSYAWRSVWNNRKGASLFGRAVVDYSFSQRQLVTWSNMYDSVYKSSQCPSDDVINDDDALDGWFISQRRNRNKENNVSTIESSLPDKVAASEEIYVLCDPADAQKVMDCNDDEAKLRWKSRMGQVKKEGIVSEANMIDRRRELQRSLYERTT